MARKKETDSRRQLDRNVSYGTISGDSSEACFEQHGILFDANGLELPGFEDVEIPNPVTVVEVAVSNPEDAARIATLRAENATLFAQVTDLEAEKEEVQGKLDTLQVEYDRVVEQLAAIRAEVSEAAEQAGLFPDGAPPA